MKVREAVRHLKGGAEIRHDRNMDRFTLEWEKARLRISRNLFEGLEDGGHLKQVCTDGAFVTYAWSGVEA